MPRYGVERWQLLTRLRESSSCEVATEGRPIDRNRWFPYKAPSLPSFAAAARYFPFRLVQPDGLPSPRGIYSGGGRDAVAFVYDFAPYGRVVLLEARHPDRGRGLDTFQEYQREAADNTCGQSEAVRIRGGIPALTNSFKGWAEIEWVERGWQMSQQDDYVFCDPSLGESVEEVSVAEDAATKRHLSDHAPLIVDFDVGAIAIADPPE